MTNIEMLACLCYMGYTEGMGTLEIEDDELALEAFARQFCIPTSNMIVDGAPSRGPYLYSYCERLRHPQKGEIGADIVIHIDEPASTIYLYEVE